MSNLLTDEFILTHPSPKHFAEINAMCKRIYPFTPPWSIPQLEAHHSYFPDGQLVVVEKKTGKIVGSAFSVIISWDDYSPQDNWQDFTAGGYFHNHDPKKGKTLYGAEVMVDPDYRGKGIGKMLYRGRQEIARKYNLKRIRAGARVRGYSRFSEKMSPEEYTKQVVNKQLSDPTLSFQLSQGFVVLDVAKNYLIDDPESLGYAALIEWLNPTVAKASDYKKQTLSINGFMNNQKFIIEFLPRELRRLVRRVSLLLGKVIREYEGDEFYAKVESYRQFLKKLRPNKGEKPLALLNRKLKSCDEAEQLKIAHAFSLLLELINVCESAYRTWRLKSKTITYPSAAKITLHFVLTAHPTEARSNDVVTLLSRLTDLCVDGLMDDFSLHDAEIMSHLSMLWQYPLIKYKATTILSEADYIYSLVFSDNLISSILTDNASYDLRLSTWVGGDKDGHSGVNYKVMRECLSGSRAHLVRIVKDKLNVLKTDLKMLDKSDHAHQKEVKSIDHLIQLLNKIVVIHSNDGQKIVEWREQYGQYINSSTHFIHEHYEILLINRILEMFPALVLPIELRENSTEIHDALTDKKSPIRLMLLELKKIANGCDIHSYAHGMIISHCSNANDMEAANQLAQTCLATDKLPIIPLFEDKSAIQQGPAILKAWLNDKHNYSQVIDCWNGQMEIMLGYSDLAKETGMLGSRSLIHDAMFSIEKFMLASKIKPVFFHGAGGSVARGGGSLRDQISWWPNSAIQTPKLTIQGEMIQRTFATGEILNSQCLILSHEARIRRARKVKLVNCEALTEFIGHTEDYYKDFVTNKNLIEFNLDATPYHYLDILKLGSRPTRRKSNADILSSLRAIPWVLCWTQTRLMLPAWWGAGSAWRSMSLEQKQQLSKLHETDEFFESYIKMLGYTLAKVELEIWYQYLKMRYGRRAKKAFALFEDEFKLSTSFVYEITKSRHLISHRPWLEESIRLRSPYISILNMLQIMAMENDNEALLKETLVGIACGMLSTG